MNAVRSLLNLPLILAGVLACASSGGPALSSSSAAVAGQSELGAGLDAYLQRTVPFGISGAFLVATGDGVILHEGYGLSDRERRVPITAESVFDIGSITKQFTAAAILKLEEQGRLRVTDSIGRFFEDVPADKSSITIHHLLTHTSGLEGDLGRDYEVMPRDSLVRLALASELQWAPGTRYDYSNLGYSLLGAIVELTSGQPYERYLNDNLLRPAGMTRTGYRLPQWTPEELAVGYRRGVRWGTPLDHEWAEDGPWWHLRANGGILSTMGDLHRWHRALESDLVLSAESRAKLFTPHVAEGPSGLFHYGYGWVIFASPRNTKVIAHNGGNGYFYADFFRYVEEDVVLILATNDASGTVNPVRQRVVDAVFSGRPPALPPVDVARLSASEQERYSGVYVMPSGARMVVSVIDGRLTLDAEGQEAAELVTNPDVAMLARYRELNARSVAIMEGASRGDFTLLGAASASPERTPATLQRIWRTSEENFGEFRSFDVLGTGPSWWHEHPEPIEPVSFVRLNFERGTRLFRFHWGDGQVTGIGGAAIPSPSRSALFAQEQGEGGHRFIGYNLGVELLVPVRFEEGADGAMSALIIETPGGDRRAVRMEKEDVRNDRSQ